MSDQLNQVTPNIEYADFKGTWQDYYKVWLVNLVLTVCTLGIYSAWAKVRRIKFFLGSTEFKGARFDFHGDPVNILKGRIIMVIFVSIYLYAPRIHYLFGVIGVAVLALGLPFLFVKSLQFRLKYTSYRNIRFSFKGKLEEAYGLVKKYLSFPIIMFVISIILASFIDVGSLRQEKSPFQSMSFYLALLPNLITAGYFILYFSKIYNGVISFIFNNIYYGNKKVSINSTARQVTREIYAPWIKLILLATFLMIAGISLATLIGGKLVIAFFLISYLIYSCAGMYFSYAVSKYPWTHSKVEEDKLYFKLEFMEFLSVIIVNFILMLITFGLAYPIAAVRFHKMLIEARGSSFDSFNDIEGNKIDDQSAASDEILDSLDFDFEFGL